VTDTTALGTRGHLGKFAGIVRDNDDPDRLCRIDAEVPELVDGTTGWCLPSSPYAGDGIGLAVVPPIGSLVWVEWPGGDLSAPPVWSGGAWTSGNGVDGAGPNTLILLTPGGHRIELDDDGKAMTLKSPDGPVITLDNNGLTIDNGSGATITMQGATVSINDDALTVQ
jgi:uncharacterized protein involved in type VI secretion and phage assembly